jgi:phosphate-selective porin OprO/OprP
MGAGLTYSDGKLFGVQGGLFSPGVANGGAGGTTDWSVTGRAYVAPHVGTGVVHVGVNGSYRGYETSTTAKFEQRPEAHMAEKVLRTGTISDPSSETRFGPEIAAVFGPFAAQAQYDWSEIDRAGGLPSVSTEGGYVETSWFVTGESRNYDVKTGAFGRPKATNALQLAARLSYLDLDDPALTDARRGTETNTTLGGNYYFNPQVRLMLNWVHAKVDYAASPDETYNIVESRIQLDW